MDRKATSSSPPKNEETPRDVLKRKLRAKTQQRSKGSRPIPPGLQSQGLSEMFTMVDKMMKDNPDIMKEMEGQVKKMVEGSGMMGNMEKTLKDAMKNGEMDELAKQMGNMQVPTKKNRKRTKKKKPPIVVQEQATENNLE